MIIHIFRSFLALGILRLEKRCAERKNDTSNNINVWNDP